MTVHFCNCPFYSLFSNYLRSQYLSVVYFVFLTLFWLQNKLSAITENRKQQLEKKKDIRREYCGKFSVITGWEFKETSCFLTEIFPSTVNLERSELNHAKSGIFDNLNR